MYLCNCNGETAQGIQANIDKGVAYAVYVSALEQSNCSCCKCLPRIKEMYEKQQKATEEPKPVSATYFGTPPK